MVLTHGELESLGQVRHRSPHMLLGMRLEIFAAVVLVCLQLHRSIESKYS
jgi:hypothetical protein